jgi:hypothetical protein
MCEIDIKCENCCLACNLVHFLFTAIKATNKSKIKSNICTLRVQFRMALQAVRAFFVVHIRACLNAFDPLIIAPSSVKSQSDLEQYRKSWSPSENAKYFLLPCLLYVIYFVDSGWVLYKYDFQFTSDGMPELFNHKLFPALFWEQTDVICVAAIACCVIVFYNLWRGAWLENRYCMYLVKGLELRPSRKLLVNGRVWNAANAIEIFAFQKHF